MCSFEEILKRLRDGFILYSQSCAFSINGVKYTYSHLEKRVSAIRVFLRSLSKDITILGIEIHDDIDTYASILALWMEGKSYVPLNPLHPQERNTEIIRQVGIKYILNSSEISFFDNCYIIRTSHLKGNVGEYLEDRVVSDDSLAYILFTSGSTGKPKGVCISRKNIAAFMDSFFKTGITVSPEDKCLQCFDLTFDVSVQSFLVALVSGACVYTVPYGQVKYLYVAKLIQEDRITFGAMAPSLLTYLRPYFCELDASSLKTCILTAEACPVDLIEEWKDCAENADLYDFYGPTEATIYCTYYKLNRAGVNLAFNGNVSIGKPLANVKAIIVGESGDILPPMEKGELCVAGDQVALGYWNDAERNQSSFFEKEVDGHVHRFYHTGDLCFLDLSGNIMYSGRIDSQAKIQGFRVELSEIEYYARDFFKKKKRVLALAFCRDNALNEIALFVEASPQETKGLISFLRTKMPEYMIPSRVIFEQEFPQNSNDKIDRAKLKTLLK